MDQEKKTRLSRRQAMKYLAALGITGPAAVQALAQARTSISLDAARTASTLTNHTFTEEQLKHVVIGLERNLNQFQMLRDLSIDDAIEPAPIFLARGQV